VASYLMAGVLAVLVLHRAPGRRRIFWSGLAALLLALAINKQLDLQSALTAAGRWVAKAQGWYDARRPCQVRVILWIISASVLAAALLTWTMRRELADMWLALIGVVFLLAFVAVRAA